MFSPVVLRLAQQHINRRLLQSVLFVVGVALGVAMVIAIDVANSSASRAFNLSTESITGKATHQILGGPSGLPTDLYRQVRVDLGLRDSAPVVEDYARAVELGNLPMHVLGVDPFAEPPFRSYLTTVDVNGGTRRAFDALNAFIAEPNTALISQSLADRYGVQAGDSITLQPGGNPVQVQVVGLLQTDDSLSRQALDNVLLTDIATAQEIVGKPGTISRIDLILPPDYDPSPIRALLPAGATLTTPGEQNSAIRQMTAAFELNLQALSLLALVVGVFLIYNTVTFSVVQRRPVIGIMRSLGATKTQIFSLILGEALVLGLIGTTLGLGLGLIFGRGAVRLVSQTISDLYFTVNVQGVTVEPFTLVKGLAIGLFASVGAAVLPSYDATRTPPAGAMRRSEVERGARKLVPFVTAAAVALNVMGLVLLALPTRDISVSFAALFCIIVGSAFFTPVVLIAAMRLFTPLTDKLFGVLGRMAPRAVARALSRTSVAVAALTVAVSVIVGVSVMISSFRNTVNDWLITTLGADIYISPPSVTATRSTTDVDPALAERVAAVEGVSHVETARSVSVVAPDFPDLPPVNLTAVSEDASNGQRRFAWLSVPRDEYAAALKGGKVMVSEPFAFRRNITQEQNRITLLTDHGPQTFEIIGVYYDYATDQGTVIMADTVYRQFYDDPYISAIAAFLQPGADVDTVLQRIKDAMAGTNVVAQSNVSLRTGVFTVFERAFSITYALQLLSTLVAFIGILSALMALQLENTRQYGTMRAVGLTRRQLWNFTLIQTGLMGIVAGALALPIGLALAIVLVYVINVRSFGWTMQLVLRPEEFILAFSVAVISALAAGIYPARRLSQIVTSRALRSE
jgi:putative ABC transport system permease protein